MPSFAASKGLDARHKVGHDERSCSTHGSDSPAAIIASSQPLGRWSSEAQA
jgi:hypothetical protein